MKKIFALLLILAMGLSLCGCFTAVMLDEDNVSGINKEDPKAPVYDDSGEPEIDGDESEIDGDESEINGDHDEEYREGDEEQPDESGEVTDSVVDPDEPAVDPDKPAVDPDEPVENPQDNTDVIIEGPVFDTSWATNEIEKMIPNPPFGPWEKTESPEDLHIIATPFDAIDYGVGSIDRMALANYFAWLKGMGFTVKEVGYSSKDVLGSELPDHWLIIDQQGRVAQLSIYCYMEGKEGFTGYSIITFELETFGIEGSGSSEPYNPQPDNERVMDMDEVLSFLPKLPFSGFTGGHVGGNIYEYSVTGLNTSGATNPPDSGEPDGKDKDTFVGYLATLIGYGFDVVEVGNGYKWTAADRYGNFVTFMIGDGGLFLTIERVADSPAIEEPTTPQEPSGTSSVTLPELPFGEWIRRDVSATQYDLIGTNVDEWEMCEVFISDLYAAGYNVFEIFFDPSLAYEYQAEKGNVKINIQGDIPNQNAVITVTE